MKFIFLDTKSNYETVDLPDADSISEKIDGWMEIVYPTGLPGFCLVVDEEGLLKEKDLNLLPSVWYGYLNHGNPIVGNALIAKMNLEGDFVSLNETDLTRLIEKIKSDFSIFSFFGNKVYFVNEINKDKDGFIPCVAVEGEKGYHQTDWRWNCSLEDAQKICDEKNLELGFTPEEALRIIISTMNF